MKKEKEPFLHSVYGKVFAAFLIGVVAIGAAGLISNLGFKEMLQTVESLSAPNEKLRLINRLSFQVNQLEQSQHANAITNPEKTQDSASLDLAPLLTTVDSLRTLCKRNPGQMQRLDSMAAILQEREKLAASYFTLRAELEKNQQLNSQVLSLTKKLTTMRPEEDKRVVTTTRKKTSSAILSARQRKEMKREVAQADNRSFFQRLFRPNPEKQKLKKGAEQVREDVHVKVDTIYHGKKYHSIVKVERDLRVVERDFYQKNSELLARELALVKTSYKLNAKLQEILKAFETEELGQVSGDYYKATMVVKSSVTRMNSISLVFLGGTALFVFLIMLDISRAHKLRKALQKAKDEAEHLGQVKQRFLANMSHELRTPLQSILGFSEQVKNQKDPDPEAMDAIFYSAEHLLQIVNEVLDYSRIVSGKFTFEKKPFNVQQLTKEVIATLQPQAQKKNLDLSMNFDCKSEEYVSGDAFRLRQVLYNLLGNAIKFTDQGSVSLTVKCSQVGDRALFSFKVKDSGIGIPEKDISRIFNQFEQSSGNDVGRHGGTGLGLSIAKSLVESQGGQLTVSSKLGEGSVFEMQVPYQIVERPAGVVYQENKIAAAPFQGHVLLVDDDAIILKLCAAILEKHQIKTTCMRASTEAATMPLPADLKVVFTDIQMPGMDGFELCKILKSRLPKDVKVYALTARALPEEHADILAKGFDGILMKPFRENELLQILNQIPTVETPSKPTSGPFDFSGLKTICGTDEEFFQATLNLFVTETRAELELLQIYLTKDNPAQAQEVVHKLAGTIGQIGNKTLAEKLKKQEQKLKKAKSVKAIKPELEKTIAEVESMVGLAHYKITPLAEA